MNERKNENGRIIILVLITVFTLSAFWFVALSSVGNELGWVGGSRAKAQQFYDAEAGLNAAIENFDALYNSLSGDVTTAVATMSPTDPTSANRVVANVTCRPIQNVNPAVAENYGLPVQPHEFNPPPGSGSGVNTTRALRYGLNSVAGQKELQAGIYLVVPK